MGSKGWMIGYDPKKELLRPCLLLDGLATIKHLYRPKIEVHHPALKAAVAKFNATEYGDAFVQLKAIEDRSDASDTKLASEIEVVRNAIKDRYTARLNEIKEIHKKYHRDAIRYLEEMRPNFVDHPRVSEIDDLLTSWKAALPQPD